MITFKTKPKSTQVSKSIVNTDLPHVGGVLKIRP